MKDAGDYISREAAIDAVFGQFCASSDETENALNSAVEDIKSIPAADVRPVVLCRDCKYYFKDEDGFEMCENSEGYDHVSEDGFCAWAAKREEADGT